MSISSSERLGGEGWLEVCREVSAGTGGELHIDWRKLSRLSTAFPPRQENFLVRHESHGKVSQATFRVYSLFLQLRLLSVASVRGFTIKATPRQATPVDVAVERQSPALRS